MASTTTGAALFPLEATPAEAQAAIKDAVSYTHLDVYKRQDRRDDLVITRRLDRQVETHLVVAHAGAAMRDGVCLLYTSRCV